MLDENEHVPAAEEPAKDSLPACGAGCDCQPPDGNGSKTLKIVVCTVVVAAIGGILLFKLTRPAQDCCGSGFANSSQRSGPVLNSSRQEGGSGAPLSGISQLNTVAANLDTVFVLIPGKNNEPPDKSAKATLASVERKLNAKGVNTGIYTLRSDSPDYKSFAPKGGIPGIVVMTKGKGVGVVSGEMSEMTIMQTYIASTRTGGCGPGGCPTSGGKSNGQAN